MKCKCADTDCKETALEPYDVYDGLCALCFGHGCDSLSTKEPDHSTHDPDSKRGSCRTSSSDHSTSDTR